MLPEIEILQGSDGQFVCFKTDDFISRHIRTYGAWGEFESRLAILMSAGVRHPLVLDVGANLGAFTVPVARRLAESGGIVHAFEPQRVIFQQLCANVIINRLDNVFAHNVALGGDAKTINMPKIDYLRTANIGAVSLLPEIQKVTNVVYAEFDSETVEMRGLDSFDLPGRCTFIKIDVEGFESEVVKGGQGFVETKGFPPILFEEWRKGKFTGETGEMVLRRQAEMRELLLAMGYQFTVANNEILAQHPSGVAKVVFESRGQGFRVVRER